MMIIFQAKMFFRGILAYIETFGIDLKLLRFLFVMPGRMFLNEIGFLLDFIVYPSFRKQTIEHPVFIIGHPRSGTTFLHTLLNHTREFTAFSFLEILFPSIITGKIFSSIMKKKILKGSDTILSKSVGHELTFGSVEEEELLLLQKFNTQFVTVATPLGFADRNFDELVYADDQPEVIKKKTVRFLEGCFQRQIYLTGRRQIIANMNYSGMRIRTLLKQFPDAKIIYLIRSPLDTIPSHLTLERNTLDQIYGLDRIPVLRLQRYFERRYAYDVAFYRYMEEFIASKSVNPSQWLSLRYEDLASDLGGVMARIEAFAGLDISPKLRERIHQQIQTQSAYVPPHENLNLEAFGLNRARIVQDLDFIFEKYGFPK